MLFAFCTKLPRVDHIALLLPVATFFLSVAVGIVAWLQWRLAHNKLRLELFDRRYKIYEATSKFVDAIVNDAAHDVDSYLNDFNAGTSNVEFLFDTDVLNYIKQIRTRAVEDANCTRALRKSARRRRANTEYSEIRSRSIMAN
jgi:hypothetical protein